MNFFLPNFDDLVDPDFDFLTDNYSPRRKEVGRLQHDWYAHQFYERPIFDGMLVSKTVVTKRIETRIRDAGGVHDFYRLDTAIPILGDCGAFTYFKEDVPPYSIEEIITYYQELQFDQGVALDHLIFPDMPTAERDRRLKITLDNARDFLELHKERACTFAPVGIIQGWDAPSRRQAADKLVELGYKHLAIGGIARTRQDKDVVETLEAIKPVLPEDATLHVFGLGRLSLIPHYAANRVTSFDNSSPIRRAFLGTGEDNFWMADGTQYAAIRVPQAKLKSKARRGVSSTETVLDEKQLTLEELKTLEQNALNTIRRYSADEASFDETLDAVLVYDRLHGEKRKHETAYARTLRDRPWQTCPCAICQKFGVEVIIFRGNNRNRRRGFHNVWAYYEQLNALRSRF